MSAQRKTLSDAKPTSIPGKIFASLFLAFFLGMGLVFLVFIGKETWEVARTYSWSTQPCTILKSEVRDSSKTDSGSPYVFEVEFQYQFNGQSFTSTNYNGKTQRSSNWKKMEELADKYPPGSKASCFVNPASPAEAALQHGDPLIAVVAVVPLIFIFVGGGGIWFVWRAPKEKDRPLSEQESASGGGFFLVLFFTVFLLVGLGAAYAMSGGFLDMLQSGSWIQVPCIVESSRVVTHADSDGNTYSVDILYHYVYENKTYRSNRYSFMGGSSSGYEAKAGIVKLYPPGSKKTCYVNPSDPSRSVLTRNWTWENLLLLIPLLFVAVGLGGLIFSIRSTGSTKTTLSGQAGPVARGGYAAPENLPSAKPVVLKPKVSPIVKFIGMLFFTLVWNGIIYFPISESVRSWQHGSPEWFLSLFMIPFLLVGLGMMAGTIYFLLAITNPRVKLALNPSVVPLGGRLSLAWGFDGKTSRIENLTLKLEGREEATYRRGTSTYTDKNVFYRQEFLNTTDPHQISQGLIDIDIPEGLAPTFTAKNNKIVWNLILHGRISRWPDVKEEFEFTVLPARRKT